MQINRIPSKDFAVSRFAVDADVWLANAFANFCEGDNARLQTLYDARAEQQRDEDGYDDWNAYLASGLASLADLSPPSPPRLSAPAMPPLTPRQLRLGLLSVGTTEAHVDALIDAMPEVKDEEKMIKAWSRIEWKYATSFKRDHPLVMSFGPALGFTEAEIDALWAWAVDI